jgi:hypothetical protein
MQQYGFGSWLKENAGNIGSVGGKVMTGVGGALTATGVGAPLGVALMGAGALASGLGDNYNDKMAQEQQFASQEDALQLQQQQQADMVSAQNKNNLIQSRLSGLQQGQQYASVFKNGGPINNNINYYSEFPYYTQDSSKFFVTPTTVSNLDNPNFNKFNDRYSYFTDPSLIPEYGNIKLAEIYNDKIHFATDRSGDQSKIKKAASGSLSKDELPFTQEMKNGGYISSYKNGGAVKSYGGELDTMNNPVVSSIDNGGTHEQSSLGGVPIGNRGLLEEGEVKAKINGKDYVFSNRF